MYRIQYSNKVIELNYTLMTIARVHRAVQLNSLKSFSLGIEQPSPVLPTISSGLTSRAETTFQDPGHAVSSMEWIPGTSGMQEIVVQP